MQIKVFTIPIHLAEDVEEEANKFLRSHRVLQIDRQFSSEHGGYWTLFVTYMDSDKKDDLPMTRKRKIDYREVLSEEEFARFARMREIRKELAQQEAVPPFVIFTDEELSILSKSEKLSLSDIKAIKGIGEKKAFVNKAQSIFFVQKYRNISVGL